MIRIARLSALEALLRERTVLSTQEIAELLGVSTATVRRDLDALEANGAIERVFGGARLHPARADAVPSVEPHAEQGAAAPIGAAAAGSASGATGGAASTAPDSSPVSDHATGPAIDDPFAEVLSRNSEAKQALAAAAAALIHDGQTLFVDVGTTTYEFARQLIGRELTVITSSLGVVDLLGASPGIDLIVLGGDYNREYRCTQGIEVERALGALHIDRAVLGCAGISDKGIVRDTDTRQAAVKRAALRAASSSLLLADASKIPGTGAYSAIDLAAVDAVVTDQPLPAPLAEHAAAHSTEVIHP